MDVVIKMCDTMVALGSVTEDGVTLFAKNSDREPNEGHEIRYFPSMDHERDTTVQTTNMVIPQVRHTHGVLLSSPHWIWGAEMGINEHGVVIGNEAVFTKLPERQNGLLGMDLLRLGLERGGSAREALTVITDLLEKHGQGGRHGFQDQKMNYHNSYLIADRKEAWVLETADRFWIAEKVTDIRTISNCLTIGSRYDLIHPNLVDFAVEKGWCKDESDFNFRRCFTAGITDKRTWGGKGDKRQCTTTDFLKARVGNINEALLMSALRTHDSNDPQWTPAKGSMASICIHAKPLFVPTQSTSSMVVHLGEAFITVWTTGTSAPCTSLFKPLFIMKPPRAFTKATPKGTYDGESLWWRHERIHRAILKDYPNRIAVIKPDQKEFEQKWLMKIKELREKGTIDAATLREVMEQATAESLELEERWLEEFARMPPKTKIGFFYKRYWNKRNDEDQMPQLP